MVVSNRNIGWVVARIKKAVDGIEHPSVTLVGKKFQSPFLVLIACILSLRTKDETTLPASQRLFRLAHTPKAMSRLSVAQIQKAIYPVGFYKTKAQRIQDISRELVDKYDSTVPPDMDALLAFKGVGRKTANLVLTEGYGLPGLCVDTHVHRISNRFGYVCTKTPEQTEIALRKKLPSKYWIEYNALLVVWGQNVCRPISPKCSQCAVRTMCAQVGVKKQR
jgi:endonuclease-3